MTDDSSPRPGAEAEPLSESLTAKAPASPVSSASSPCAGPGAGGASGNVRNATPSSNKVRPLQYVRVLSWTFLVLILGFNFGLSVFISNYADKTLLEKQQQFSLLLAENLNHQIYTRFTLPTLVGFGRIRLSNPKQTELLDKVVRSTIHSFHVQEVRIYALDEMVVYSTDSSVVGKTGLSSSQVRQVIANETYSHRFVSTTSKLGALFSIRPDPGTMLIKYYFPMFSELTLSRDAPKQLMGILEFTQDITEDYIAVLNFERLVIAMSLLTSIVLFYLIMTVLKRADRLNQERLLERERLERELMQQEKLAGMGRMVAGVAHEIRNPLGIIRSSAELVLKKTKKEGLPHERLLQAMYDESTRLSRVVTDFLDYARPKTPRRDTVDLARVLEQVAVFLENEAAARNVVIQREVEDGLTVQGDKDLLYRAVYNIVSNAIQAMEHGGKIILQAAAQQDGLVHLVILDQGPGFAPEHLHQLKDPFFTTKDTGTGLGLAITASILEGHGAQLDLSNVPGGGARVDIIFPRP